MPAQQTGDVGPRTRAASPLGPVSVPTKELELLAALRRRDESAFTRLIDVHHNSLLRVARMYVGTQAVAEEVVQETWLGVLKGLDGFEGRCSLKTWIFQILMNPRFKPRLASLTSRNCFRREDFQSGSENVTKGRNQFKFPTIRKPSRVRCG